MQAIVITDPRSGKLELVERAAPRLSPGNLLVRVHAAAVNPIDWKLRTGLFGRVAARFIPEVPGLDVAGIVEAVAPGVAAAGRALTPGTPVLGMAHHGGAFAELALVPATATALKPEGLSFVEAAAIPVAGLTALQALRDLAGLASGQRLLVNGAAGGVGTFAVQLGRVLGARVTAVTSAHNAELASSLGAERVIDYGQQDFVQLPDEYEVIFDAVAKRSFAQCASRLTSRGIYISTLPSPSTLAGAAIARLGLGGKRAALVHVEPLATDLAYLAQLAAEGKIKPVVERVLPFAEADAAFAQSCGGHVRGKLVLELVEA